ncbi:MAG: NADH-quinone oxidoreductase subunit L [Armatimonadota bacterium]
MIDILWVCVFAPFLGAFILAIFGNRMAKTVAGIIGCATVGLACVSAIISAAGLLAHGPVDTTLYTWMNVGGLQVPIGLHLDALSIVMLLVVTFVGFLIHLYASQSMYDEDGYSRFFCYMNLFVGSMVTLVLANNLLLLYLGWEGVGLCSYLLIGFWYKDAANGHAAQKAFIVTRFGDTALAIGLFLIYIRFGTLEIQPILALAPSVLTAGGAATLVAFLIIGGAIGKSAQVPLQVWLPDAMAGPTPVSALIHAATMVTAGVYLIARMHVIFEIAPMALTAVAIIGTITLFYSGFSALVQRDIKRVLAYSTISQIGYMFLALGVGAWTAAMFHFVTHAFFKALLFLSAGVVIDAQHHEHDIFKMGGLRRKLPVAFWTFLIGSASLSALPLITAGFFSKDAILWAAYSVPFGVKWLWIPALISALITAIYSFRVLFLVFFGEQKLDVHVQPRPLMTFALAVLAFFSLTTGYISWPGLILHFDPFGSFMSGVFGTAHAEGNRGAEIILLATSAISCLLGIGVAYLYFKQERWAWVVEESPALQAIHRFFFSGWGFDWLYDLIFVRPYRAIAYANRSDFIDSFFTALATLARWSNVALSYTQTGRVRNYAAGIVLGAIILTAIVILR